MFKSDRTQYTSINVIILLREISYNLTYFSSYKIVRFDTESVYILWQKIVLVYSADKQTTKKTHSVRKLGNNTEIFPTCPLKIELFETSIRI